MADLSLSLDRTALVLVDFTNGFRELDLYPRNDANVFTNATRLAEAFRAQDALVVLTRPAVNPPPAGAHEERAPRVILPSRDMSSLATMFSVPDWSEIADELGPEASDHVIRKTTWNSFRDTDLDFQLRRRGIINIVLGGIATNFGAESTAREARAIGYGVIAVEDAMCALTPEEHEHAIRFSFPAIGEVRSSREVIASMAN